MGREAIISPLTRVVLRLRDVVVVCDHPLLVLRFYPLLLLLLFTIASVMIHEQTHVSREVLHDLPLLLEDAAHDAELLGDVLRFLVQQALRVDMEPFVVRDLVVAKPHVAYCHVPPENLVCYRCAIGL